MLRHCGLGRARRSEVQVSLTISHKRQKCECCQEVSALSQKVPFWLGAGSTSHTPILTAGRGKGWQETDSHFSHRLPLERGVSGDQLPIALGLALEGSVFKK